jgi:predicted GNAT family N-acyltransferase
MTDLPNCDEKMAQVTDVSGRKFTGIAVTEPADYCFHEYGRDEEAVIVNNYLIYISDIREIRLLPEMKIIRATETWQQAGAYYVRIQAMAKKHHITLRAEFDEHDGPDTKYIVVTDHDFPIATARMYPIDERSMMIGRVVVLPEYRHQGIGTMVVNACEEWAEDLRYLKTVVESRDNKVEFYEELGYEVTGEAVDGETFRCIRMEKDL